MFRAIRHAVVLLGIVGLVGSLAALAAVDSPSDPEPATKVEHSTIVPAPAGLTAQEVLKTQSVPQAPAAAAQGVPAPGLVLGTKERDVSTIEIRTAVGPSPEDLAKLAAVRSAAPPDAPVASPSTAAAPTPTAPAAPTDNASGE